MPAACAMLAWASATRTSAFCSRDNSAPAESPANTWTSARSAHPRFRWRFRCANRDVRLHLFHAEQFEIAHGGGVLFINSAQHLATDARVPRSTNGIAPAARDARISSIVNSSLIIISSRIRSPLFNSVEYSTSNFASLV